MTNQNPQEAQTGIDTVVLGAILTTIIRVFGSIVNVDYLLLGAAIGNYVKLLPSDKMSPTAARGIIQQALPILRMMFREVGVTCPEEFEKHAVVRLEQGFQMVYGTMPAVNPDHIKSVAAEITQEKRFRDICSTGSHEDEYGIGSMSISAHRPLQKFPWLDLGQINYTDITEDQFLDAYTSPNYSSEHEAYINSNRRVSKLQAEFLVKIISESLQKELRGEIPSDETLKKYMPHRFPR